MTERDKKRRTAWYFLGIITFSVLFTLIGQLHERIEKSDDNISKVEEISSEVEEVSSKVDDVESRVDELEEK